MPNPNLGHRDAAEQASDQSDPPVTQQFIDASTDSTEQNRTMVYYSRTSSTKGVFNFKDNYDKEFRCPNISSNTVSKINDYLTP